jgi:hypothetical protein
MLEKPAGLYSRFYTEILRFGSCFGSSLDLLELGFLRASLRDRQTDRQTGRQTDRQTETDRGAGNSVVVLEISPSAS